MLDARRGAGGLDDVRAHQQVGEVQRGRLGLVVADAADAGGEVDDRLGRWVANIVLGRARHGEVVLRAAGGDDVGAPARAAAATTWRPRNPEPPVTRTRRPWRRSGMRSRIGVDPASWAACASPTPSSSAGTTRPAARRSRPSRSPGAWRRAASVTLVGVAGRHRAAAAAGLAVADPDRPAAAAPTAALRVVAARCAGPLVERVTGPGRRRPRHRLRAVRRPGPRSSSRSTTWRGPHDPDRHTRQGHRVLRRSLDVTRDTRRARRHVERGQPPRPRGRTASTPPGCASCRSASTSRAGHTPTRSPTCAAAYDLPERFVLFVGTLEPRKNLRRLAAAMGRLDRPAAARRRRSRRGGATSRPASTGDVRFLGFVPAARPARRCTPPPTVFAYPSEFEGFGLPGARGDGAGHARSSRAAGTSTEEVAGGAAVLVDPFDVDAIAAGIDDAQRRARRAGRRRSPAGRGDDVGGRGAPHRSTCTARPLGVRVTGRLRVGVNLLWCLPGAVGGSEEYLVRQLDGLHDVAPEIDATLFVVPGFAAAHPDAGRPPPARRRRRSTPGGAAGASSPRRPGCRRGWPASTSSTTAAAPCRRARPARCCSPIHDVQYRTYPEYLTPAEAPVPPRRRAARRSARPTSSPCRRSTSARRSSTRYRIDADRVVVVPHGVDRPDAHHAGGRAARALRPRRPAATSSTRR